MGCGGVDLRRTAGPHWPRYPLATKTRAGANAGTGTSGHGCRGRPAWIEAAPGRGAGTPDTPTSGFGAGGVRRDLPVALSVRHAPELDHRPQSRRVFPYVHHRSVTQRQHHHRHHHHHKSKNIHYSPPPRHSRSQKRPSPSPTTAHASPRPRPLLAPSTTTAQETRSRSSLRDPECIAP